MIGQLRGKLIYKQPPLLLIDVQGVGYELEAPMTTFYNLPEISKEICLFTHLVVRDDEEYKQEYIYAYMDHFVV